MKRQREQECESQSPASCAPAMAAPWAVADRSGRLRRLRLGWGRPRGAGTCGTQACSVIAAGTVPSARVWTPSSSARVILTGLPTMVLSKHLGDVCQSHPDFLGRNRVSGHQMVAARTMWPPRSEVLRERPGKNRAAICAGPRSSISRKPSVFNRTPSASVSK